MVEKGKGKGAVRNHFLEVLEDALDLGAIRDVVFDAVDEGRDGDAAGVRGTWGQVFGRAALAFVSTAKRIELCTCRRKFT